MKVFNRSNRTQEIRITDRYNHMYKIYIPAGRTTELEPYQVSEDVVYMLNSGVLVNVSTEADISTIENIQEPFEDLEPLENATVDNTETCEDTIDNVFEDIENTKPVDELSSVFKCEHCGNEFGSLKGLRMHISKSHPETIKEEV